MSAREDGRDVVHPQLPGPLAGTRRAPGRTETRRQGRRDRRAAPPAGDPAAPSPSPSLRRHRSSPAVDVGRAPTEGPPGCVARQACHCAALASGTGSAAGRSTGQRQPAKRALSRREEQPTSVRARSPGRDSITSTPAGRELAPGRSSRAVPGIVLPHAGQTRNREVAPDTLSPTIRDRVDPVLEIAATLAER